MGSILCGYVCFIQVMPGRRGRNKRKKQPVSEAPLPTSLAEYEAEEAARAA